jgi:hypothetical protein
MLRAGRLLASRQETLTLRFDARGFPPTPAACYLAPWRLPGPDLHRLTDTSLPAGHFITSPLPSSVPADLGTQKNGLDAGAHGFQDFVVLGVPPGCLLRVDEVVAEGHFEDSAPRWD